MPQDLENKIFDFIEKTQDYIVLGKMGKWVAQMIEREDINIHTSVVISFYAETKEDAQFIAKELENLLPLDSKTEEQSGWFFTKAWRI